MLNRGQQGGTAVEYCLLAALVAGAIVAMVFALGQGNATSLQNSCDTISTAMGSDC